MPTDRYIIRQQITIKHQAGDTGDIVFEIPSSISLTGKTVKFRVSRGSNSLLFQKTQPEITVSGQTIIIPMLVADTEGLYGTGYLWELEISKSTTPTYITVGQGVFEILRTYIPSE